ncbi:S1 RNA-binding domain-containing protein [Methanorbis furvi]
MRIEYSLFLCLGYLWKNIEKIPAAQQKKIVSDLSNLSIGHVVEAIRTLDLNKEVFSKKSSIEILNNYPSLRNSKIGHGYAMGNDVASALIPLYDNLYAEVPFLQEKYDLIVVENQMNEIYKGVRFPYDRNGEGERWSCAADCFQTQESYFPRTYICINGKYCKISPFIHITRSSHIHLFSSLQEKLLGKSKMCHLFSESEDSKTTINFPELICISEIEDTRRRSSNGTLMSNFKNNYFQYIDVGINTLVLDFLKKNRASVSATIWGHGGVGKTACIQSICNNLFNDTNKTFSYIIFISAKDRQYNTKTGKIDTNNESDITYKYSEILNKIIEVIHGTENPISEEKENLLSYYEEKIRSFDDKILIVIDDYETFDDFEKAKIKQFINTLDINYHKVIITTRNKRFILGESIPSNELDLDKTKTFLKSVVQKEYPEHYDSIQKLISDKEIIQKIYSATSGRPIFIYQFAHLYVQRGYKEEFLNLKDDSNAKDFLYGRIYNYLSNDAKHIFVTLSTLADENLTFRYDVLKFCLSKVIPDDDKFDEGVSELEDQRIIEPYSESSGRIYSTELRDIMLEHYNACPQSFRNMVKSMIENLGGKNIDGSVVEALLCEADKSRPLGNEQETTEKYRHILNTKTYPIQTRKTALKNLADYLSNSRLSLDRAIVILEEYISDFSDDADIHRIYIYYLWARKGDDKTTLNDKTKADLTIRRFFTNHDKTDPNNLAFFALGVGYCIDYDLNLRKYESFKLKYRSLNTTFTEYGMKLFEHIQQDTNYKAIPAVKHNVRMALIQIMKICYELGKEEQTSEKIRYGLKICSYMSHTELPEPFKTQVPNHQNQLKNLLRSRFPQETKDIEHKDYSPLIGSWAETVSSLYEVGMTVDVVIKQILPYGIFVDLDEHIVGLIHISEIDFRFIENIYNEFEIGETCPAMITSINLSEEKIALSTKGLGKFAI